MKNSILRLLCCPVCHADLAVVSGQGVERCDSGTLRCASGAHEFPVKGGIPRFVPDNEYASSFGMQWNKFKRTQLDRYNGTTISKDRFYLLTGWDPADLKGQLVLDAGCGAGRFAQVALDAGAEVIAMDLSSAVDACQDNLGSNERLHVVQASIYDLPFKPGVFDRIYSIGVLQHTPDVGRAVKALPPCLKNGGKLAYWIYEDKLLSWLTPKYPLRLVTTRIDMKRLFGILEKITPSLLWLSNLIGAIPFLGRYLRKLVPVANYTGLLPLSEKQLEEWALLDTFDWLSPRYDQPQTFETVSRWLGEAGCKDIQRIPGKRIGLPVIAAK